MDNYEKVGYGALGVVAVCYLIAMLYGVIAAFPFGLLILLGLLGVGVLLVKVLKERMASKEDDYYDQNVEK
jgi:CHASE2 domain-containing sensor protein